MRGACSRTPVWADESGPEAPWADESGSVVTSIAGVVMFLAFLLLAAHTTIHLYGTSTVTAVAFDAARRVAAESAYDCDAAETDVARRLGRYATRAEVRVACEVDGEQVVVSVAGPSPANLLAGFGRVAGIDTLDRTVRVRREAFVEGGAP
jgi:hypothetical protein